MKNRCNNWWICLLLLCISCTENEVGQDVSVNPGEVRMTMNISTRATNDPEVLNVNETRISRIRVYVFDGTTLDKMYYWTLTATNGTYTTPVFTVKAAIGKSLYAVVNEPTDMNTRAILESVDHPNDLIDVQYQMADYLTTKTNVPEYTKDYCLPMYGELNGIDAAEGTTQTINMKVDRAVARVDVYMRKEAGNSGEILTPNVLVVTGVSKTGYIAPAKVGNYASSTINIITRKTVKNIPEETSAEDKGMLVYSFYLPEMECKDRKLNLGFDDYETIDLGGDSDNSGGAILEKLERNHVYQLLCRFTAKTSTLDVNLTVCPWIALEPNIDEIYGNIHITNCFIVPPGGRVHIPTDGVYKAWAQLDEFEHTPIPDGEVMAEVLRQDEIGVMTDHSIKVMNASLRDKASVIVETGEKAGNAVIVMKVNGEIYWSWHIWCTDYNPNLKNGQQELNGYVWMDRNIGATYNFYNEEGGIRSKGFLYQWGRKDLFPPAKGWEKTEADEELYGITGELKLFSRTPVTVLNNISNSVHNPMTFYTSSDPWYTVNEKLADYALRYLWNTKLGKKTLFDPCPAGWRVPAPKDVEDSPWPPTDCVVFYKEIKGSGFNASDVYYPAAGYRLNSTGDMMMDINSDMPYSYWGRYWSGNLRRSFTMTLTFAVGWGEGPGYVGELHGVYAKLERASAVSVRCVKE